MTFQATVLTLYPEMFPGPLGVSLAGRAREEGKWALDAVQIRDFAIDKHRNDAARQAADQARVRELAAGPGVTICAAVSRVLTSGFSRRAANRAGQHGRHRPVGRRNGGADAA
jgi:hypothetical protein